MIWKQAFLKQAESDYSIFEHLNKAHKPLYHQLHYLQMASEKLAKSFLCPPNGNPPKQSHYAFVKFLLISQNRPEIRKKIGYDNNYSAFKSYLNSLLPFAERIEKLAPSGSNLDKPNPEYPWKDHIGNVIAPVEYEFKEFSQTEIFKFKQLLNSLIRLKI